MSSLGPRDSLFYAYGGHFPIIKSWSAYGENLNSTFNISGPLWEIILYKFESYLVCLGRTHGAPYRGYGYVPLRFRGGGGGGRR